MPERCERCGSTYSVAPGHRHVCSTFDLGVQPGALDVTPAMFESWAREKLPRHRLRRTCVKKTSRHRMLLECDLPNGVVTTGRLREHLKAMGLEVSRARFSRWKARGIITPEPLVCVNGRGHPSDTWRLRDTIATIESTLTGSTGSSPAAARISEPA